jgi:hypothetical protein
MPVITIPFDYDEKLHPDVVPICISDTDRKGNPIHPAWVELGVVPVAERLRTMSHRILKDVFRVSEVTETAVHSLSRNRGADLGTNPELIVYKSAEWCAVDLKAGGRRARTGYDVELFAETLDQLRDEFDLITAAETKDVLDKLVVQATELGMDVAVEMVPMILRGASAQEYEKQFGKKRNTLTQMFFRNMRKAAKTAHLSF